MEGDGDGDGLWKEGWLGRWIMCYMPDQIKHDTEGLFGTPTLIVLTTLSSVKYYCSTNDKATSILTACLCQLAHQACSSCRSR